MSVPAGILFQTFLISVPCRTLKAIPKKYGVTGAGGQDQLKGKVFRIATLGYADKYDVITAVAALEFTLRDLGYTFEMGKGVAKAVDCLKDL